MYIFKSVKSIKNISFLLTYLIMYSWKSNLVQREIREELWQSKVPCSHAWNHGKLLRSQSSAQVKEISQTGILLHFKTVAL